MILMIVFNAVGRGTYWRAFHLARCLAAHGRRVALLAMAPQRQARFTISEEQGVTIIAAPDLLVGPLRSGWDPYAALVRSLWALPFRFALIHAFECRPAVLLPALVARARSQAPLVLDWCDWFGAGGSVEERPNPLVRATLRPVETFFEERFRTWADGTTVICRTLHDKAVALGVPPTRILSLRDGADVAAIRPGNRMAARAACGLPANAPLIGYVGQIFPRDGRLMAAAFDQVRDRLPAARLLLIGHVNMPIEASSRHPGAIIRSGAVPYAALNSYLAACDLCWLPLVNSGANRGRWPLKLNDYMAAGRATVATAVGDVTEVLQHYPVGRLAQDTPASIAHETLALLDNPAERAQMEQAARETAERHFDWRLRAAELAAFYKVLM